MRGAFDTTCDLKTGPAALVPDNVYAVSVPCRLVASGVIAERPKFLKMETHYMTLDAVEPAGAPITHGPPNYTITPSKADRVAIPSGGPFNYGVLWVEVVTPSTGTPYYRARLTPLPDSDGEY